MATMATVKCLKHLKDEKNISMLHFRLTKSLFISAPLQNFFTKENKKHAVIVTIYMESSNLEIANFLNIARYFLHKVLIELEDYSGIVSTV